MAIQFIGAGTLLQATSMVAGETIGAEFADAKSATGTVITCSVVGTSGVLKVYKIMRGTGNVVELTSEICTDGLSTPLVEEFDYPIGHGKVGFLPDTHGDVTSIEIEFRSKGR